MLIVDAQIHIWRNNKPTNPNHRQVTDYTADDVLREMDAGGVNAALIHPPGWDPNSNALAVEAAERHPNRLAILGNFPLDKPESRTLIDGMKGRPGMLGLRFALIQPHQQTWLTDGRLDWLWAAAERAGTPVALIGPGLLDVIGSIAQRHPGLKLIIERYVLARLRNRRFFSLVELNGAIREIVADLNSRVMRKVGVSRRELLETIERPALKELPSEPYPYAEWKKCRVAPDYHVEIEYHYYSVPSRLIRKQVDARITSPIIEVFADRRPIAS